ncbi:hypothetical protein [Cytophaga hutchinsonii]|jgi:hypothetical protein|uniref:Uncharacterized protein n=1 Tax=Cytophaga hutchinsonii (strain ATCC 33406 / DSM 1761 / CIP 103989 / NBRC 15051 / NCIMB 9469 / D465) TaxID=269798 RepID=A0A6N4SQU8_CYTH3|nr:hypothetical protein [Cytophaga hutchinsonii]ABG58753.1 hypothetical protein CHU_1482 [Cytophaga hutchinsonii ATCC 33406]SFX61104.1 hypothetical protein SAMN04487930_106145 [Cytophaga hutchinsonii ATCC 33406]
MAKAKKRKRTTSRSRTRTRRTSSASAPLVLTKEVSRKEIGVAVLSFFGGTIIGAALGKYSGLGGLAIAGLGAWKKNMYATSLGAGMFLSTVPKPMGDATNGISDEEMEGVSIASIKENTKNYFQTLASKLMLKSSEGTNGLSGEDDVTYFINPYTQGSGKLDTRELDRIQEQIAQMNNPVNGTFGEPDFTERNF